MASRSRGGPARQTSHEVRGEAWRARRTWCRFREDEARRSSPSAAAASRWRPATRCSTSTCSISLGQRSERPRVCFLPTASGDADHYIVRFYRAFPAASASPPTSRCSAATAGPRDLREHLLAQDLIYVGGGSVLSLLGTWRAHGIDTILAEGLARRRDPLRAQRRIALLVLAGRHLLPRRGPDRFAGSACCRGATASTTAPARAGARPTTSCCSAGCARATRPRTAPRCTSAARS